VRLFRLSTAYPSYLRQFYARRPGLAGRPWADQMRALDVDAFGWADAWGRALAPLGYETWEVYLNAEPAQRAWALEHAPGLGGATREEIVRAQVLGFRPDVLWFDHPDATLLGELRRGAGSIRLVLGWVGSAIPVSPVWRAVDLMLTCAPESVERLRAGGAQAELLHHAFDPGVLARLEERPKAYDATFIGQIAREAPSHAERARLIEAVLDAAPLAIFSPNAEAPAWAGLEAGARRGLYRLVRGLRGLGFPERALRSVPVLGKALAWPAAPLGALPARIRRALRPPRYGLEMFQTLRDSRLTLDSSSQYASNMRLFEATGAGTCLVTNRRENLPSLFVPEAEVVTYRSAEECVERVRWLLEHPQECEAIARAGHSRTLRDHTFEVRAVELDRLIRGAVA
jgi:hypothetical protein